MLIRSLLILVILACLGVGGLGYYEATHQILALTQQRDKEHRDKVAEKNALVETRSQLEKIQVDLTTSREALIEAQKLRDSAVTRVEAQGKRANELSDKLAKAVQERDDARNLLATYVTAGITPDQVAKLSKSLKDANAKIMILNAEKAVLARELARIADRLPCIVEGDTKMHSGLVGKIVVVDPKWNFVVLNIGDDQGALEDGELLVSRDGKLVAKVVIRSVQKDRCIADVVPGWKLGEMFEGDTVTPAHPAS